MPYAEGLQGWIDMARAHGHEVLLEAPMEPVDYPDNDPGPYTLMAGAQGARDSQEAGVDPVARHRLLRPDQLPGLALPQLGRGLRDASPRPCAAAASAFIDDGAAAAPRRRRAARLGRAGHRRPALRRAIDQQLLALEAGALQRGQALGSGFAYPVTLEKVAHWSQRPGAARLPARPGLGAVRALL